MRPHRRSCSQLLHPHRSKRQRVRQTIWIPCDSGWQTWKSAPRSGPNDAKSRVSQTCGRVSQRWKHVHASALRSGALWPLRRRTSRRHRLRSHTGRSSRSSHSRLGGEWSLTWSRSQRDRGSLSLPLLRHAHSVGGLDSTRRSQRASWSALRLHQTRQHSKRSRCSSSVRRRRSDERRRHSARRHYLSHRCRSLLLAAQRGIHLSRRP